MPTTTRPRPLRRTAALLLPLLAALGILVGTAAPALAHAELVGTSPAATAVLHEAPQRVTLTFGEGVFIRPDAIKVYDGAGQVVGDGPATQPAGHPEVVTEQLRAGLADGAYTVTWRITSDDSHVESGTYTFSIAVPGAAAPAAPQQRGATLVPRPTADQRVGMLLGVARGVGYVGVAAGLGALLVALLLWPAGLTRPATRRTVAGGLAALGLATVAAMLLQQVAAAGTSLAAMVSGPVLSAAPTGRFGHVMLMRLAATAAVAGCAWLLMRPAPQRRGVRRAALATFAASAVALVVSWPLVGHASTGNRVPLSLAVTSVHVAAMVVWLGGLALLLPLAVRRHATALADLLPRFSPVAFGAVVALVGTGIYQSWREVGSVGALTSTTYGRVLLAKTALVVVLIGLGNLARRWVLRRYSPDVSPPGWPSEPRPSAAPVRAAPAGASYAAAATAVKERSLAPARAEQPRLGALRRGLTAEVVTAMFVLIATAALTGTARAKDTYAPAYTAVATGPVTVLVHVDHAHTGAATLTLTETTPAGKALPTELVTGELSMPGTGAGSVPVQFSSVGASQQRAAVTFSARGRWMLRLFVQTSAEQAVQFQTPIPIR